MFHVKHGQFFTILNHPFAFVNFQLHPVKYYGGKFANVNPGKVLIISALRQVSVGAFGFVFPPARVPWRALCAWRPVPAPDHRMCRPSLARARPRCGRSPVLLPCCPYSPGGRPVPPCPALWGRPPPRPAASLPLRGRAALASLGGPGGPFLLVFLVLLF